jgi:hypothetical protein
MLTGVPLASQGQAAAGRVYDGVPGRGGETHELPPGHPPKAEHRDGKDQLDGHGVAEAQGTIDGGPECRQYHRRDDSGVYEVPHDRSEALVDHDLGQEKQRNGDQAPGVCIQIVDESNRHNVADPETLVGGQHHERQPGHQRDTYSPANQEAETGGGGVQAEPELIQRSAEDQRKVLLIRQDGRGADPAARQRRVLTSKTWGPQAGMSR